MYWPKKKSCVYLYLLYWSAYEEACLPLQNQNRNEIQYISSSNYCLVKVEQPPKHLLTETLKCRKPRAEKMKRKQRYNRSEQTDIHARESAPVQQQWFLTSMGKCCKQVNIQQKENKCHVGHSGDAFNITLCSKYCVINTMRNLRIIKTTTADTSTENADFNHLKSLLTLTFITQKPFRSSIWLIPLRPLADLETET